MTRINTILSVIVKIAAVIVLFIVGVFFFHLDKRTRILLDNVGATSAQLNHRLYDKEGIGDVTQEILNRSSGLVEVTKSAANRQREYWDTLGKKKLKLPGTLMRRWSSFRD